MRPTKFPGLFAASLLAGSRLFAYDDLTILSDEFDDGASITNWQRIEQTEGWGNNALAQFDINTTRSGQAWMIPHSSSWYAEWRGVLFHKVVTGDFVITTDVEPRNRAGTGAPASFYSLAGIMVRTPRAMTNPAQWTPNGQNYVFLSLGTASNPGTYQFEVKTTTNSSSTLYISNGAPARASIQVARLGAHLILLRRDEGGSWQVHQRYLRSDMPATLQAGLTVYTDWPLCESVGAANQNRYVLTNGATIPFYGTVTTANPDLQVAFDYVRFARPSIPPALAGAEFSNPGVVSDAELLSFLGEVANTPGGSVHPPSLVSPRFDPAGGFTANILTESNRSYRVQASGNLVEWSNLVSLVSTNHLSPFADPTAPPASRKFYRVVSP